MKKWKNSLLNTDRANAEAIKILYTYKYANSNSVDSPEHNKSYRDITSP